MSWMNGSLLALDFESTGIDTEDARIVTATLVEIKPTAGKTVTTTHNWTVDPQIPIPDEAAAIHGVTTEIAQADGVHPVTALTEIVDRLAAWGPDVPLIAYNVVYDATLLDRELRRWNMGGLNIAGPVIDPFCLDKAFDKYRKGKRTLAAACEVYKVTLENAHTSAADALAAARVAWKIAKEYPAVGEATLAELHERQVGWYAEQSASLAAYLRKQAAKAELDERVELMARAATITGDWPMTPVPAVEAIA